MVCSVLGIALSSFYDYLKRSEVNRLFTASRASAGSRTRMLMMWEQGHQMGRYRVRRLMKGLGLVCKQPGSHAYKTATVERLDIANRLNREFTPGSPINPGAGTLPTLGRWLLVLSGHRGGPVPSASCQGSQYTSRVFRQRLWRYRITQSMSRRERGTMRQWKDCSAA
ncbi:hypothetical protein GCM10022394_13980 [Zobellella aerophila]|uniref:HTH-like domain-containing protein n=1 Tax=Zobellella aerophila TaxID=870480 RepID=A0ABP6VKE1_9GAMM